MPTINYKIIEIERENDDLETQLNTLGAQGWEIVQLYNTQAVLVSGSSGITVSGSVILPAGTVSSSTQVFAMPSYGQWFDTTIQSGSSGVEHIMKYDSEAYARGFVLVDNTKITALQSGLYNIQFSAQLKNTVNESIEYNIWFKKNGSNIPWSNTAFEVHKTSAQLGAFFAALNLVVDLTSGSYVQLAWSHNDGLNGATLFASGSTTDPVRPAIPSIITTVTQIA